MRVLRMVVAIDLVHRDLDESLHRDHLRVARLEPDEGVAGRGLGREGRFLLRVQLRDPVARTGWPPPRRVPSRRPSPRAGLRGTRRSGRGRARRGRRRGSAASGASSRSETQSPRFWRCTFRRCGRRAARRCADHRRSQVADVHLLGDVHAADVDRHRVGPIRRATPRPSSSIASTPMRNASGRAAG